MQCATLRLCDLSADRSHETGRDAVSGAIDGDWSDTRRFVRRSVMEIRAGDREQTREWEQDGDRTTHDQTEQDTVTGRLRLEQRAGRAIGSALASAFWLQLIFGHATFACVLPLGIPSPLGKAVTEMREDR
jgi:hypothetical protein